MKPFRIRISAADTRFLGEPLKCDQKSHCNMERRLCGFNPVLVLIMRTLKHNPKNTNIS